MISVQMLQKQLACRITNSHKFRTIARHSNMAKPILVLDSNAPEEISLEFWWFFKHYKFLGQPVEYIENFISHGVSLIQIVPIDISAWEIIGKFETRIFRVIRVIQETSDQKGNKNFLAIWELRSYKRFLQRAIFIPSFVRVLQPMILP